MTMANIIVLVTPLFMVGGMYNRFLILIKPGNRSGLTDSGKVEWNEFNASAGLSLPLNISAGEQNPPVFLSLHLTTSTTFNGKPIQKTTRRFSILLIPSVHSTRFKKRQISVPRSSIPTVSQNLTSITHTSNPPPPPPPCFCICSAAPSSSPSSQGLRRRAPDAAAASRHHFQPPTKFPLHVSSTGARRSRATHKQHAPMSAPWVS